MKLMEDWQGDKQGISPKVGTNIDLLFIALEQVKNLTNLLECLEYLSQYEQLESIPVRHLDLLIDAMNRARHRLEVLEAEVK
jgi:hypothetical protein